jgi:hypothetical protein
VNPKVITSLALVLILALPAAHCRDRFEREEIKKTFPAASIKRLLVDNISGSIHIVGKSISEIRVVAKRTINGESDEKIAEAKEDVRLEFTQGRDRLEIVVTAPWRNGDHINWRGKEFYGYEVQYDFEIEVPQEIILFAHTVNEGDIDVQDVKGRFDLQNVNGAILAKGLAAEGNAHTVNGSVEISFAVSPKQNCSFKTINGRIEVEFPNTFGADVRFKTMNGKVYSDFEYEELPQESIKVERKYGTRIYRRGENSHIRIRNGGPELSFETLNGNINILKSK